MPTGPEHARLDADGEYHKCRCMIGQEHDENGWSEDMEDDDDDSEALSASDAADIWRSSGMDEDRMFGYSEDELRNA